MIEVIDILKVQIDFTIGDHFPYHRCKEFQNWRQYMADTENEIDIINVSTAINPNEEYMIITITYRTNDDDPK